MWGVFTTNYQFVLTSGATITVADTAGTFNSVKLGLKWQTILTWLMKTYVGWFSFPFTDSYNRNNLKKMDFLTNYRGWQQLLDRRWKCFPWNLWKLFWISWQTAVISKYPVLGKPINLTKTDIWTNKSGAVTWDHFHDSVKSIHSPNIFGQTCKNICMLLSTIQLIY